MWNRYGDVFRIVITIHAGALDRIIVAKGCKWSAWAFFHSEQFSAFLDPLSKSHLGQSGGLPDREQVLSFA